MPIYEYRCQSCDHEFEALQRISEGPLTDCPDCAEPALKKLVSAAAFRLKGGGWYETDFKSDNQRNLADKDKKAAADGKKEGADKSDGKGKGEKKADQKPAAKETSATKESKTSSKKAANNNPAASAA